MYDIQTNLQLFGGIKLTHTFVADFFSHFSGNSGMGCYHGRHSFDQLSHLRSCLIKQLKMEGVNSMRYPPHTAKKLGWARFFLLKQVNVSRLRRMALLAALAGLAAFVVQVKQLKYSNPVHRGIKGFALISIMFCFTRL